MQIDDVRVGDRVVDGSGVERLVWAVILGKVYFYQRVGHDRPWQFDRHAAAPSVEDFARRHN
jgi:hypothetical protein